jgi:hypothetical protein
MTRRVWRAGFASLAVEHVDKQVRISTSYTALPARVASFDLATAAEIAEFIQGPALIDDKEHR